MVAPRGEARDRRGPGVPTPGFIMPALRDWLPRRQVPPGQEPLFQSDNGPAGAGASPRRGRHFKAWGGDPRPTTYPHAPQTFPGAWAPGLGVSGGGAPLTPPAPAPAPPASPARRGRSPT